MKHYIIASLVCALICTACSSTQHQSTASAPTNTTPTAEDTPPTALSPSWRLSLLGEQKIISTEETPTLGFDMEERRVFGYNGCNRYFGAIKTASAGKLEFGLLATTMMACPEGGLEAEFMSQINQTKQFRISGDTLYLLDAEGKTLLGFERTEGEP